MGLNRDDDFIRKITSFPARVVPTMKGTNVNPSSIEIHRSNPLRGHLRDVGRIAGLFALVTVLLSPLRAGQAPTDEPGAAPAWTAADYALHSPATFRQYAPAKQRIRRDAINHHLLAAAVFYASNEQRARHKVPLLTHSEALRRAAQGHTREMAHGGFFSHTNPRNPARRTPSQRLAAEGVAGVAWAENIAKTTASGFTYLAAADAIVAMWMKSPGHRRNLLNPKMRRLGCGVHASQDPAFQLLATQNFASAAPN